jgi:NAD(P)-dependent dehydrogenase (short-subunit alcohol dehydrogenase family)
MAAPQRSGGGATPTPSPPATPPPYAIVTGANAGLGKEIARGLMERGHHVVLACRRMDACEVAAEELRQGGGGGQGGRGGGNGSCVCAKLDVSDFDSVREFARSQRQKLAAEPLTRPLILCNNAGVMGLPAPAPAPPPLPTPIEPHLATNHLGAYLLTRLLMPELKRRPGSRVVFVASRAHYGSSAVQATTTGPAPQLGGGPEADARLSWFARYCRSKLLNVQTAASAHARLAPHGSAAFSVSPGFVATSIFGGLPGWLKGWADAAARRVARTPAQGAAVAVFACTDAKAMREALASVDPKEPLARRVEQACGDGNPWLFVHDNRPMRPSAAARDAKNAEAVWQVSALLTGLEDDEEEEEG